MSDPRAFLDPTPEGRSRETEIRRDAAGHWWNADVAITHPNVAASFDGWIRRAEDGRLCLVNDINWAYVAIEGAPYTVRHVTLGRAADTAEVRLHLSGALTELLDPATLRLDHEGRLYCDVLEGSLAAVFSSAAMNELAEAFAEEGAALMLGRVRVALPTVGEPLLPHRGASVHMVDAAPS
jgi:hypothetical protein